MNKYLKEIENIGKNMQKKRDAILTFYNNFDANRRYYNKTKEDIAYQDNKSFYISYIYQKKAKEIWHNLISNIYEYNQYMNQMGLLTDNSKEKKIYKEVLSSYFMNIGKNYREIYEITTMINSFYIFDNGV